MMYSYVFEKYNKINAARTCRKTMENANKIVLLTSKSIDRVKSFLFLELRYFATEENAAPNSLTPNKQMLIGKTEKATNP